MFHILGFIFLFILVILIIGLGIIATVVRKLFNLGSRTAPHQDQRRTWQTAQNDRNEGKEEAAERDIHPRRKKIFADDEGEYVDFEEIKPEN